MTLKTRYVSGNIIGAGYLNWVTGIQSGGTSFEYNSDGTVGSVFDTVYDGGAFTQISSSLAYYSGGGVKQIAETRPDDSNTITTKLYYDGGGTTIDEADLVANWVSGGDAIVTSETLTKVWFKPGSALQLGKSATSSTIAYYTKSGAAFTDLSGTQQTVFLPLYVKDSSTLQKLDTRANGGVRLLLSSDAFAGSYYGYNVGGNDTLTPGWNILLASGGANGLYSPSTTSGAYNPSGTSSYRIELRTVATGSTIASGNIVMDRWAYRQDYNQMGNIITTETEVA